MVGSRPGGPGRSALCHAADLDRMARIIELPQLSPTTDEAVFLKWVKRQGDPVSPGDIIAEVDTVKATLEIDVEEGGVLLRQLVREGDVLQSGAPLAIVGQRGDDLSALLQELARRQA